LHKGSSFIHKGRGERGTT